MALSERGCLARTQDLGVGGGLIREGGAHDGSTRGPVGDHRGLDLSADPGRKQRGRASHHQSRKLRVGRVPPHVDRGAVPAGGSHPGQARGVRVGQARCRGAQVLSGGSPVGRDNNRRVPHGHARSGTVMDRVDLPTGQALAGRGEGGGEHGRGARPRQQGHLLGLLGRRRVVHES